MSTFKARGIVIGQFSVGDNDKSLRILLKNHGKYSVWAKNCRSSKSVLLSGTSLFCYADFIFYDNGKSISINQVDVIENFYSLTKDLDKLSYATYIVELTEKNIQENQVVDDIMLLLIKSLMNIMNSKQLSPELISRVFELKFLQFSGYAPIINKCVYCDNSTESVSFFGTFGCVCKKCINLERIPPIAINNNILYTINYILSSDFDKLFSFNVSQYIINCLEKINSRLLYENMFMKLKSLKFLRDIKEL